MKLFFAYAAERLKQNKIPRPFFLVISSIDLHPPFIPLYTHSNAKGNVLLNCLYSSDHAFGNLWKYFINSDLKNNTLLIVVADHAMGRNFEYRTLMKKNKVPDEPIIDYIFCSMYIPGNKEWHGKSLRTICTNLDLAPTIMDMLNINAKNPFMGLSIFTERPKYPVPISKYRIKPNDFIYERMTDDEKRFFHSVEWTRKNRKTLEHFLENLALRNKIVPDE